jgi:hypothetical protein
VAEGKREMLITMSNHVSVPAEAKTLSICCKVSDMFTAHVLDANGQELGGQDDGYVPEFMPGKHYGDYVMLDIDLDTGTITNWETPAPEAIEKFIGNQRGE